MKLYKVTGPTYKSEPITEWFSNRKDAERFRADEHGDEGTVSTVIVPRGKRDFIEWLNANTHHYPVMENQDEGE